MAAAALRGPISDAGDCCGPGVPDLRPCCWLMSAGGFVVACAAGQPAARPRRAASEGKAVAQDQSGTRQRIVAGVDGSLPSRAALGWAVRHAALTGAAVEAIIAWEPPTGHQRFTALDEDSRTHDCRAGTSGRDRRRRRSWPGAPQRAQGSPSPGTDRRVRPGRAAGGRRAHARRRVPRGPARAGEPALRSACPLPSRRHPRRPAPG